jgi:hypothetical protein
VCAPSSAGRSPKGRLLRRYSVNPWQGPLREFLGSDSQGAPICFWRKAGLIVRAFCDSSFSRFLSAAASSLMTALALRGC